MAKVKKDISFAEAEAQTDHEKSLWGEARIRSERLLVAAQKIHDYLHGTGTSPSWAENAFKEADAVRVSLQSAISIRMSRAQEARNKKGK